MLQSHCKHLDWDLKDAQKVTKGKKFVTCWASISDLLKISIFGLFSSTHRSQLLLDYIAQILASWLGIFFSST